jgi:hypothetical protein
MTKLSFFVYTGVGEADKFMDVLSTYSTRENISLDKITTTIFDGMQIEFTCRPEELTDAFSNAIGEVAHIMGAIITEIREV